MPQKTVKAAPRHKGTASGVAKLTSCCKPENSDAALDVQSQFLIARFGLDLVRARIVAELAWGRA